MKFGVIEAVFSVVASVCWAFFPLSRPEFFVESLIQMRPLISVLNVASYVLGSALI